MPVRLITYDLVEPDQDYEGLFDAIKSLDDDAWHCLDSVWMVRTPLTAAEVRGHLKPHLDSDDRLLVVTVTRGWATKNIPGVCTDWLYANVA